MKPFNFAPYGIEFSLADTPEERREKSEALAAEVRVHGYGEVDPNPEDLAEKIYDLLVAMAALDEEHIQRLKQRTREKWGDEVVDSLEERRRQRA